ncbi:MAG: molybdopterin-dependent oxidoreductase [Vicinamibacterales bacterium]
MSAPPMDRRRFLKVTAITGTTAALAGCGNPENQIVRFIPEDELTPGIAEWKPSVCGLCAAGCGVVARVMDGDAEVLRGGQPGVTRMGLVKKLEGDPAHPISQGRLCVRGQAGPQVTYHPDRVVAPLRRSGERGQARFDEITWEEALGALVTQLDGAAPDRIAFLGKPRRGRRQQLVSELLGRLGAPPPVSFEVFDDAVLRRANELSFGRYQLPTFDLARTRYLLSLGADLLGTWNSPLAHAIAYGAMRQGRPGVRAKFVQAEPRMSQTGANADEWVAVRSGTEGALALGLAHVILRDGLRPADAAGTAGALVDGWSAGVPAFAPAEVETITGVAAARIERLARELATHGPAVVAIGGAPLAHTNGLAQALAVNALNALVGSVGVEGGVSFTPQATPPAAPARTLTALLEAPPPQVLLLDDANPLFAAPASWQVGEWLRGVPFVVSFGSFVDDTTAFADLVLPDHSFLESWTESAPESGATTLVATVAAPVAKPLYDTRSTPDVLLEVSRRLARPPEPALPWQTFDEMLQAPVEAAAPPAPPRAGAATAWQSPALAGAAAEFPFHFLPYPSQAFVDGSLAHLPWLQELPDPLTSAMWSSWVELNGATAQALGVGDGDIVEVRSAHGTLQAPVVVSPGLGPETVAMPVGQGHDHFTRYASGRGANPLTILAPEREPATGALAWAATRVALRKVADKDGRLILFAGATRERPAHKYGRG